MARSGVLFLGVMYNFSYLLTYLLYKGVCVCCAGIVTLSKHLDYESCSEYHLVLGVHDTTGHGLVSTSQLTINVLNVNDHAPRFSHDQYRLFLPEHCHVGSFVIQLVATDADSCHGNYSVCDAMGNIPDSLSRTFYSVVRVQN